MAAATAKIRRSRWVLQRTCGFKKTRFSLFSAGALGDQPSSDPLGWSQTSHLHMEEKMYFCLILFSLWSTALYSASAAAAEMLIGFDCRLPAEFCVASREAALPETSRSSGGDWAFRSLFFFHHFNHTPPPNTLKICYIWAKNYLQKGCLSFEGLCILTNGLFHFFQQSAAWERDDIFAVHLEFVVGLNVSSGRCIVIGWKWCNGSSM